MIQIVVRSRQIGRVFGLLILIVCCHEGLMAQEPSGSSAPEPGSPLHATHILGFGGIANNKNGDLTVQGNTLRFQRGDGSVAEVPIGSIQDLAVGEEDKQVGGMPMTLTQAAAPYGGGRIIALMSHKKYDTVTLEYLDSDGGFHGAIFQLEKGKGEAFRSELNTKAGRVGNDGTKRNTEETKNEIK